MRPFIAGHEPVTATDVAELALGTPLDLWLGVPGETDDERAARLDAARDILADHPSLADDAVRIAAEVIDMHPELFDVVPLVRPARRRATRKEVAA